LGDYPGFRFASATSSGGGLLERSFSPFPYDFADAGFAVDTLQPFIYASFA
jgi:hypothetical protein